MELSFQCNEIRDKKKLTCEKGDAGDGRGKGDLVRVLHQDRLFPFEWGVQSAGCWKGGIARNFGMRSV